MTEKDKLRQYLNMARDVLLWKLEGLSDYDVRRPMTPTGTNLLGLIKHVACCEFGYFGYTFGRPLEEPMMPRLDEDAEPNVDMWAGEEESRADILGFFARARAHSDATIEALELEGTGHVQWWPPERETVTLQQIIVHMIAEINRHAGHADIVRELIDGETGLRAGNDNMAPGDQQWWADYRERLEKVAREAG